jgi:GxxExxY protein
MTSSAAVSPCTKSWAQACSKASIPGQRLDIFVDGRIVLELKSVELLHPIHVAQVVSYLRLTGARLGLLINFNVPVLKQGIRRVIL